MGRPALSVRFLAGRSRPVRPAPPLPDLAVEAGKTVGETSHGVDDADRVGKPDLEFESRPASWQTRQEPSIIDSYTETRLHNDGASWHEAEVEGGCQMSYLAEPSAPQTESWI